jgi:hypothetical protein
MICSAKEKKVNGAETPVSLAVRPTIYRLFKLFERAGIRIGKLVGTSDSSSPDDSNDRASLLCGFRKLFLAKGLY